MTQDLNLPRAADTSELPEARTRKSRLPLVAATLSVGLLATAAWLAMNRHPAGVSPLEPTAATSSVLVPAEREPVQTKVAAIKPVALAGDALAGAAVALNNGASTAASATLAAMSDTFTTLRVALDQLTGRVGGLEAHVRLHDEQIAALRLDVDNLKNVPLAARAAGASASAVAAVGGAGVRPVLPRKVAPVRRGVAANAAPAPSPLAAGRISAEGSVLAVDLWGGKPSVALARAGSSGTELRFFNEGESQGRVTLKRADIGSQKATFATPSGEFTLAPKEQ